MAVLTNLGSTPILFLSRNHVSYTIPVAGSVSVPDSDVTYDLVDAAVQSGVLSVELDSGLPFFDTTGAAFSMYAKVDTLGFPAVARTLAATATSQNTALTSSIHRISIKAKGADIRYVIGTGAQTASATDSHFIEAGERLDLSIPANSQIAVIRDSAATTDGTLYLSELM